MKKKVKPQQPQQLSPKKYFQTRASTLPLFNCFINKDYKVGGMATIVVARQHKTGNITFATFLVDLYALGVKDVMWKFNIPEPEFQEFIKNMDDIGAVPCDYKLAHSLIWGSVDFATAHGFKSHPGFQIAKGILADKDDRSIKKVPYQFGHDGKPFVIGTGVYDESKYIDYDSEEK